MATELQKAANRRNALLSTGPRSLAGKARSRMNAVSHGLTAQQTLLPGEDPAEYEGLRRSMFNSLRPDGALENELVERIASLTWRLRRFAELEVALFHWTAHLQAQLHDQHDAPIELKDVPIDPEIADRRNDIDTDADTEVVPPPDDHQDHLEAGRMFEALLSSDVTSRMTRYETGLQRQLRMSLDDLLKLQKARDQLSQVVAEKIALHDRSNRQDEVDEWVEHKGKKVKRMLPP